MFGRKKGSQRIVEDSAVARGGPMPSTGDVIRIGGDLLIPVAIDQNEIPDTCVALAEMALRHLNKPLSGENMLAALELFRGMLRLAADTTLNIFCSDPNVYSDAITALETDGDPSLIWIRSLARNCKRGTEIWDYEVMKVYSFGVHPESQLAKL